MKKLLLSALLLSSGFAFAQITPAKVNSPMEMSQLYDDFPGMRPGFTLMKLRLPSVTGTGETTWYDYVPGYNTSKVVNAFAFNSVDPNNPLEEDTRIKSVTQNGNSYTYVIELNDVPTWADYERQTVFLDATGKDTSWILERHNGTAFYNYLKRVKNYNGNGSLSGILIYTYDTEWMKTGERKITYSGNQRTNDIIELDIAGSIFQANEIDYIYNNNKLDSILHKTNIPIRGLTPYLAFKFTVGTDGGIDQIITHTYDTTSGWKYGYRTNFTGGTSGLKNISTINANVYPNPANSVLNISVKSGSNYNAQLVDLQGRICLTANFSETTAVNIEQLNNGVYFLLLTDNNGNATQKRVVVAK